MAKEIAPLEPQPAAAEAIMRLADEYELVRHTTGVLYALRGDEEPITLDWLVGRLAREYRAKAHKVASDRALRQVKDLLANPEAPERDLSEQLAVAAARRHEKLEAQRAALQAEQQAAREAELAEVREEASALLVEENLMGRFATAIEGVVVGEDAIRAAKLLHLVLASRLLNEQRVGSETIKGQSAAGKTFLAENVLAFFPPRSLVKANSMSPKALFYRALEMDSENDELVVDLSHHILYLGETAAITEVEFTLSILRQLLSDGEVAHETVIDGKWVRLLIRGPVSALITTTRAKLDPEFETRFFSDRLDESEEATRAVMRQIAKVEAGLVAKPDVAEWRALHRYLELQTPHEVVNPILDPLAEKLPARAIRMRRDLTLLSLLMRANALLHLEHRNRDELGRIVATRDDYAVVRGVVLNAFDYAIGQGVPDVVRMAVGALPPKGDAGISYRALGDKLDVNHETAKARVWEAIGGGYAVNVSTNKYRAELTQADPLPPANEPALPELEALDKLLETYVRAEVDGNHPPLRHSGANPDEQRDSSGEWASAADSPLRHSADGVAAVAEGGETALRHSFSLNNAGLPGSGGMADGNRASRERTHTSVDPDVPAEHDDPQKDGSPRRSSIDPDPYELLAEYDRKHPS
jgi:hypothetical protein